MSRPTKKRRISALPPCTRFIPQEGEDAPEVNISLEEYECIRLLDYVGMTQEECARQMGVARTTVQALYLECSGPGRHYSVRRCSGQC